MLLSTDQEEFDRRHPEASKFLAAAMTRERCYRNLRMLRAGQEWDKLRNEAILWLRYPVCRELWFLRLLATDCEIDLRMLDEAKKLPGYEEAE